LTNSFPKKIKWTIIINHKNELKYIGSIFAGKKSEAMKMYGKAKFTILLHGMTI
jgi:hypothetical protein